MVNKMVSPEEKPIIENIISLFQQLLTMQNSAAPAVVEEGMETEEKIVDEAEVKKADDEDEVEKAVIEETGDNKAEERIENVTPTTDQSLQDLQKSLSTIVGALGGKKTVQKAIPQSDPNVISALGEISKVMKNIVETQTSQEQFNKQLMESVGITNEVVQKSITSAKPNIQAKPIGNMDSGAMNEMFINMFQAFKSLDNDKNPAAMNTFNDKRDVRKNLKGIANFIHEGK